MFVIMKERGGKIELFIVMCHSDGWLVAVLGLEKPVFYIFFHQWYCIVIIFKWKWVRVIDPLHGDLVYPVREAAEASSPPSQPV